MGIVFVGGVTTVGVGIVVIGAAVGVGIDAVGIEAGGIEGSADVGIPGPACGPILPWAVGILDLSAGV